MTDTVRLNIVIVITAAVAFAVGYLIGIGLPDRSSLSPRAEVTITADGTVTGYTADAALRVTMGGKTTLMAANAGFVQIGRLPEDLLPASASPGPEGYELRWVPRGEVGR